MTDFLVKKAIEEVLATKPFQKIRHREYDLFIYRGTLNAAAFDNSKLFLENRMGIAISAPAANLPESQLKALIAHELAHHLHGDYRPQILPVLALGLFIIGAFVSSLWGGIILGSCILVAGLTASGGLKAHISRWREYRADHVAAQATGPNAVIALLSNLGVEYMEPKNKFMWIWDSHPMAKDRIEKIEKIFLGINRDEK